MRHRLRRLDEGRWLASTIALLALTGLLAGTALGRAASPDRTPPTFDGLKSATTCIPGPTDGQTAAYTLRWDPATDDITPSGQIAYDIYQATKSGDEDFASPTYSVRHGAASFTTPALSASTDFYFVVRARDRSGDRDSNFVERVGENLCV